MENYCYSQFKYGDGGLKIETKWKVKYKGFSRIKN